MFLRYALIFIALSAFSRGVLASSGIPNICHEVECSSSVLKYFESGYENEEVIKFKGSNYFALSSEGDVNKCYVLFIIASGRVIDKPVVGQDGNFCNFKEIGDNVMSSWRSQGGWSEDIYQVNSNGKWVLLLRDFCVGCSQVKRTFYKDGVEFKRVIVSDGGNYLYRKELIGVVKKEKIYMYNKPDEKKRSTAYLIKDDNFTLIDMSEDGFFYKIKYKASNNKERMYWIKSEDFESQ